MLSELRKGWAWRACLGWSEACMLRTSGTKQERSGFLRPLCSDCTLGQEWVPLACQGWPVDWARASLSMVLRVPTLCRFLLQSLGSLKYGILVPARETADDGRTPEGERHAPHTCHLQYWKCSELLNVTQQVNSKGGYGKHFQLPSVNDCSSPQSLLRTLLWVSPSLEAAQCSGQDSRLCRHSSLDYDLVQVTQLLWASVFSFVKWG